MTLLERLTKRIEQAIQEHIAESHDAVMDAVARAFAEVVRPRQRPTPNRGANEQRARRRTPEEIAGLSARLYQVVCERPGEPMAVLSTALGATPREMNRSMNQLKRVGQIRSVGERNSTRYFPLAKS
jgi:hypothetical protein